MGCSTKEHEENFAYDGIVHFLDSRHGLKGIHIISKLINLYSLNSIVYCQLYLLKLFLKSLNIFF